MRRLLYTLTLGLLFGFAAIDGALAQPFWVTSIGGSGWSGTLANNGTDNSTVYTCYNSGITLYSNMTVNSIVNMTKTYYRKWQTSSDGASWFTTTGSVSSYPTSGTVSPKYYRVCYSYSSSSTDILYPSPWVRVIQGPSFVSTPPSFGSVFTNNITGTSFTAHWKSSSTAHGPGISGENLVIRHYMFCSSSPTFAANTQPAGGVFNSACAALMTSCSEPTSAIPGCTDPNDTVSYTVTGLTPGVTYYWKIIAQSWHENSSNGDLYCGEQSSYTTMQTVPDCAAPVVTSQPATQAVCSGNTGTLSVVATGATSYQWQLNGTDIPGATSSSYGATAAGNYSCWTYSSCDSALTAVAVVTIDQPSTSAAGPDQNLCINSATLAANTPLTGTGTWSMISGSGSLTNASDPNTTVTALGAGNNTIVWTMLNGACSDSRDTVIIAVQTPSTDPVNITGTATICNGASTTLTVNGGTLGTGANWEWYTGSCGTGTHAGTGSSVAVSPTSNTTYYALAEGGCNTTTCASLPVDVTTISADAGTAQTMCTGDSVTLTVTGTGSYLWSVGGLTTSSIVVKPAVSTTYTVTVTNGSCTAQDTVNVNVTSFADATITTSGTLCTGQVPFALSAVDAGGTWSGSGITNTGTGMFSPVIAGPGPHQIIHTFSGTCGDADTTVITVATSANATITPVGPYCSNVAPVTLTAANAGGTWSGLGITNTGTGEFSPAIVGAGTYTVVYTIAGICGDDDTISITINPANNPTITSTGPYCTSVSFVTLTAASAGGTWSGQGITNTSTGQFSPSLAGNGTFSVMYTSTGVCSSTDTASITVGTSANATITSAGPFCSSVSNVILNAATAGGTWSGSGITNPATGAFSPSSLGPGSYNVIYAIAGVCGSSDTLGITINAASNATINAAGPYCSSVSSITLGAATAGGTWAGQGVTNAFTGTFSPSSVGAGSWDVVYSISGSCGDTDTLTIVVNNAANASIDPVGPYCYTDGAVVLTAADNGGVWTGNGITNTTTGAFDPGFAGPGTHLITYTITGSCGDTATMTIVVDSIRDASILSTPSYCDNIAPFALSAATSGGTWSGAGITNPSTGLFNPATAGTGDHTIIYSIPGSCGNADTANIRINDSPDVAMTGTIESCTGSYDGTASATVTGGTAPYGYAWDNSESSTTISQLEPGIYYITVTDANCCRAADSVKLEPSTVDCEDVPSVIYIPNIFSPNGDGDSRNNMLTIIGEGIKNVEFRIYDRWGEKIFESRDINEGWNGDYKGKPMDQGVYVYTAVIELYNGTLVNKKGNVTLVR